MEPIGDEGVVSFARALEKNKTLIEITYAFVVDRNLQITVVS